MPIHACLFRVMQPFARSCPTLLNTTSTALRSPSGAARRASRVLARSASTASTTDHKSPITRAANTVRRVERFYDSPELLKQAVRDLLRNKKDIKSRGLLGEFVMALERAPFVEGRWGLVKALREAAPRQFVRTVVAPLDGPAPTSHTAGLEAISRLEKQRSEPLEDTRGRAFGVVLRWRFPDALFAPLSTVLDVFASAPDEEKGMLLRRYLTYLTENAYHVRANWEREALAARGSSSDAVFASALETVRAAEEYLASKLPAEFDDRITRGTLLRAYSALQAPTEDSMRHWTYLVQKRLVAPWAFDAALRSARDGATIIQISSQWPGPMMRTSREISIAQHYCRLGLFNEAGRVVPPEGLQEVWGYWALRNEEPTHLNTKANVLRYKALSASGFSFNEIEWLLVDYPSFRVAPRSPSKPKRAPRERFRSTLPM